MSDGESVNDRITHKNFFVLRTKISGLVSEYNVMEEVWSSVTFLFPMEKAILDVLMQRR